MLFAAAAVVGAILIAFGAHPKDLVNSATFHFARATAQSIMNIYMIKMAAVFMITASTLAIHIRFVPRCLALLGYLLALLLLFGSYYIHWSFFLFPLWVFLMSIQILADDLLAPRDFFMPRKYALQTSPWNYARSITAFHVGEVILHVLLVAAFSCKYLYGKFGC
jgi:hypothetical protein